MVGPHVGLPTLRALFPEMPRCVLIDLQQKYRHLYQEQNRVTVDQLTWMIPGRVWAMDHAEPPRPIDGRYHAIFAVRDLATGMQLAWTPLRDMSAEATLPPLETLFREHGPPLVLKSDNGSAFISVEMSALLERYDISHLLSPPRTPSYNGSCEAGIGSLKTHTSYQAARHALSEEWTVEDLATAQQHVNAVHRAKHNAPTAADRWEQRTPVSTQERHIFRDTVDRHRREMIGSFLGRNCCTTKTQSATIERIVIRRALVELGMLTMNRRSITLPIKPNNLAKFS
jgi:transposase InsO family protein